MDDTALLQFIKSYKEEFLIAQLKHIKLEKTPHECIVTLVDSGGYDIVRGYGKTAMEALNDLHSALV
ncbi:hypothetical protein [Winogradskyella sp.]|jgi:hypothetical protein|uniref:hypothetical protein n=1 Tax=Winogradskyella sp. TaxID=1883156 RepID=UPI0025D7D536|nr:hypothetical protein [Winogradskyella sp.]MCT4629045.1 hypothetical protein [Winogradskyella sp.]